MTNDDALRATIVRLHGELRQIEEKRVKILNAVHAIEDLIAPDKAREVVQTTTTTPPPPGENDPAYTDGFEAILKEAGRPLHLKELYKRANVRGWYLDKEYETVRASSASTLDRKVKEGKVFTKPGAGIYGLVEWNAGKEQEEASLL